MEVSLIKPQLLKWEQAWFGGKKFYLKWRNLLVFFFTVRHMEKDHAERCFETFRSGVPWILAPPRRPWIKMRIQCKFPGCGRRFCDESDLRRHQSWKKHRTPHFNSTQLAALKRECRWSKGSSRKKYPIRLSSPTIKLFARHMSKREMS